MGKTASVQFVAQGTPQEVLLKHLHSSGTAALRDPTFDVLPRAQGYGLQTSRVDQASTAQLATGPVSALALDTTTGARSLVDLFSGLLALGRLAIVARPDTSDDYRQLKLAIVSTALGNSGGVVEITDADLLSLNSSPVEVLDRAVPANFIKLELENAQLLAKASPSPRRRASLTSVATPQGSPSDVEAAYVQCLEQLEVQRTPDTLHLNLPPNPSPQSQP